MTAPDSGWASAFPSGWRTVRFGMVFRESTDRNGDEPVGEALSVSEYRGVTPRDTDEGQMASEDVSMYRIVRPGQLAANVMWLNRSGLGVSRHLGYVSPAYKVFDIDVSLERRYADYLLRSTLYRAIFESLGRGVRPNAQMVDTFELKAIPIPLPDRDEQVRIADFLDRETAKIDALIDKQLGLVRLLEQRRQSVITSATSGEGHPRVSTGSVWYPLVPQAWRLTRVRDAASVVTDGAHISPDTVGGVHDFVSTRDISNGGIDLEGSLKTSADTYEYMVRTGCRPEAGDVLFSKDGTVGETAIVPPGSRFVVASSLVIIRPKPQTITAQYLRFALLSKTAQEHAASYMRGAGLPRLSVANLARVELAVPPLAEQRQIVDSLVRSTTRISALMAKAEEFVTLARERRAALITAAVTGQLDVRAARQDALGDDLVAPLTDDETSWLDGNCESCGDLGTAADRPVT